VRFLRVSPTKRKGVTELVSLGVVCGGEENGVFFFWVLAIVWAFGFIEAWFCKLLLIGGVHDYQYFGPGMNEDVSGEFLP
jgi:hypothetical protein